MAWHDTYDPLFFLGLSKWVRGRFQTFRDFQVCLTSITQFVENQTNPKPKDPEITEIQHQGSNLSVTRKQNELYHDGHHL